MGRVFVFNQHTKELLPSDLGADAEFNLDFDSHNQLEILSSLLQIDRDALLLAPTTTPGFSCAIHVRVVPRPVPSAVTDPIVFEPDVQEPLQPEIVLSDQVVLDPIPLEPVTNTEALYEATGFLGLSDTICDPPRRRRWWHWFWS